MTDPREERATRKIEAAKAYDAEAEKNRKEASKLRAEAARIRAELQREALIADPLICKDHGLTCLLDNQGAMATGYPYHVTIDGGKVVHSGDICQSGRTIGRLSEFGPDELATYRRMVNRHD
jgi:hypothetical protein